MPAAPHVAFRVQLLRVRVLCAFCSPVALKTARVPYVNRQGGRAWCAVQPTGVRCCTRAGVSEGNQGAQCYRQQGSKEETGTLGVNCNSAAVALTWILYFSRLNSLGATCGHAHSEAADKTGGRAARGQGESRAGPRKRA